MVFNDRPIHGMDQCEFSGKRVLVRVDHNVPCTSDGQIRDDERIVRSLETLRELIAGGARIIVLSHFGYPQGKYVPNLSTRILAERLSLLLKRRVRHCKDRSLDRAQTFASQVGSDEIVYLENSRFWDGERSDSMSLAKGWAGFGDLYINEAFSASHRRHASIHSLSSLLPALAGRQLERERRELMSQRDPDVEFGMILGGAKFDQKLKAISEIQTQLSVLCLGGMTSIAVMKFLGRPTGTARFSSSQIETVEQACSALSAKGIQPQLPLDWRVRASNGTKGIVSCDSVCEHDTIIDIGPRTVQQFMSQMKTMSSVFWNGPLGIYEESPGERGSVAMAKALAHHVRSGAKVVLGGGDTLGLIASAGMRESFSYCSAGGGAALEFISRGDELPGLTHLFGDLSQES